MLNILSFSLMTIYVILAIVVIWLVSLRICKKGKNECWLFLFFGIFYCYLASGVFYENVYENVYEIIAGLKAVIFVFIFIVLRRKFK